MLIGPVVEIAARLVLDSIWKCKMSDIFAGPVSHVLAIILEWQVAIKCIGIFAEEDVRWDVESIDDVGCDAENEHHPEKKSWELLLEQFSNTYANIIWIRYVNRFHIPIGHRVVDRLI